MFGHTMCKRSAESEQFGRHQNLQGRSHWFQGDRTRYPLRSKFSSRALRIAESPMTFQELFNSHQFLDSHETPQKLILETTSAAGAAPAAGSNGADPRIQY